MAWTAEYLRKVTENATKRAVEAADKRAVELLDNNVGGVLWDTANRGASAAYLTEYSSDVLDALSRLLKSHGFTCTRHDARVPYLLVLW